MSARKDTSRMTRAELADIIVDDQIKRGVIAKERKDAVVHVWLHGNGAVRPVGRDAMLRIVNGLVFT